MERLVQGNEQKFKTIELTLASIDNRFSYTPTILVTSGGGGGNQGMTISNPATTDSETVKVSRLLDVAGDGKIDGKLTIAKDLTVDTNTFFVDSEKNRVGIGTLNLDTAFEVVGTASISNNLFVGRQIGINTNSPTTSLEVQGTASASYLLTGNTLQVGGFASVAYSRFGTLTTRHSNYISASNDVLVSGDIEVRSSLSVGGTASISGDLLVFGKIGIGTTNLPNQLTVVGSGSFTGQLKATRNPTIAHTGTWPSFTNTNDATLYINPSSPVADGNVIAYTNGSDPKFVVDAEGDVFAAGNLTLVGTTTQATTNVTGDLTVEGNARLGDAIGDKIKIPGTVLPYTLSSFPLLVKASASQTVDLFRIRGSSDNTVLTVDQGTGLLTASSGFNFALGFSTATVSYSRLGTATTGYSSDIDKFNDLLISGALEVDGNSFLDGKASISGNFQTGGRFIFGDSGDTGEINTSDWDISSTGNLSGIGAITSDGILTVSNRSEFQGTASASYLLTGNTLQVGGFASAAYNRFGTATATDAAIGASNDLLISDSLEVDGTFRVDGTASHTLAGEWNFDSNTLGIDSGTNRVGIATSPTSLDTTLEVGGTASISGTLTLGGIITSNNTGSNSFSGSLEISKGVHATGSITTGADLRINGNTTLGDATGDTITANADAWTFANDTNFTLSGGVNGLSFDTNTLSIDATNNRVGILTTAPSTTFEVQGTASASYLLTGNTLQVGGFSSAAYSRFGTATATDSAINTTNDLLISGALEVDDILRIDGTGTHTISGLLSLSNASVSGNFELTGNTRLGINAGGETTTTLEVGGTASISGTTTLRGVTYTWPSADGTANQRLTTNGSGTLSWATAGVSSNSLDFDEFVNTMLLDSNLTINRGGYYIGLGAAPSTVFEVQGTASASYLLTGNTLQVGGYSSTAYSRFGTSTTGHSNYITTTNDVLVSGDLEVRGTSSFGGVASVSGNFFTYGTNTFGGTGSSSFAGSLSVAKGFLAGANNAFRVNANATADTLNIIGGNVGIGTTVPGALLHVVRTAGSNADIITVTGSGTNDGNRAGFKNIIIGAAEDRVAVVVGGSQAGAGASSLLWADDSNDLRIRGGGDPTGVTDGTVVGTQTSSLDSKNVIGEFTDYQGALQAIVAAPLYDFTYKSGSFNNQEFTGIITDYSPVFGMDRDAAHPTGKSLNVVTGFGYTFAAIKELDSKTTTVYSGQGLVEGDVVAFESEAGSVARAEDNGSVIGVVKSEILNSKSETNSNDQNSNVQNVRIAFSGRTEVKVTEENGAIVAGDRLTVSKTLPGYAMKMTESGQSIGIALEKFEALNPKSETNSNDQNSNTQTGKILAFVNLSYWAPSIASLSSNTNLLTQDSNNSDFFSSLLNQFKQLGVIFENGIVRAKEFVAEKVTANIGVFKEKFCLDDVCITKEQFRTLLEKNQISPIEEPVTATPSPSPEVSASPIPKSTPEPASEPTPEPTVTPESTPEITPTLEPTPSESPSPTPELTPKPTTASVESSAPNEEPTPSPTFTTE